MHFSFSRSASIPLVFAVTKMVVSQNKRVFSLAMTLNAIGKIAQDWPYVRNRAETAPFQILLIATRTILRDWAQRETYWGERACCLLRGRVVSPLSFNSSRPHSPSTLLSAHPLCRLPVRAFSSMRTNRWSPLGTPVTTLSSAFLRWSFAFCFRSCIILVRTPPLGTKGGWREGPDPPGVAATATPR